MQPKLAYDKESSKTEANFKTCSRTGLRTTLKPEPLNCKPFQSSQKTFKKVQKTNAHHHDSPTFRLGCLV